jgi:hypothetical protein
MQAMMQYGKSVIHAPIAARKSAAAFFTDRFIG